MLHLLTFHCLILLTSIALSVTTDDAEGSDCLYSLFAVVVHVGSGPHHGHYVCLIKAAAGTWLQFDDEHVEAITEQQARLLA